MIRRICLYSIFLALFIGINCRALDGGFLVSDNQAYAQPGFIHLSQALYDLKPSELSQCISYVRNPDMDSRQIADFVFEWDPEKHKKGIAAVFRNKITRLTQRLKRIDYEQLIIDIDLIKNSHLTTGQIIKMLTGLKRQ